MGAADNISEFAWPLQQYAFSPNQPGSSARTHLPLELFKRLQRQGGGRRGASLLQREAQEF
jgi:hypothetical protein